MHYAALYDSAPARWQGEKDECQEPPSKLTQHENAPGYAGNTVFRMFSFDMHIMMKSTCQEDGSGGGGGRFSRPRRVEVRLNLLSAFDSTRFDFPSVHTAEFSNQNFVDFLLSTFTFPPF
jgi:hypothetical protein